MNPRLVLLLLLSLLAGCDTAEEPPPCAPLVDDTFTASVLFFDRAAEPLAQFDLQQEIRTYETGTCRAPEADVSAVRLVIRNLTACTLTISPYRLSVFVGPDGWTVEGTAQINPNAADDRGIVQPMSTVRVDQAQTILTGESTLTGCP